MVTGLAAAHWLPALMVLASPGEGAQDALEPKFGRRHSGVGLGVSVGDPTGVSLKVFVTPRHAISSHVAWGVLHHGDGLATLDYHWHSPSLGHSPIVKAHVYVGLGVGLAFWARPGPQRLSAHSRTRDRGAALILRAPALGIAYHWLAAPIDTSIEIAWSPYLVAPDLRHLDASLKLRYFF